MIHRILLGSQPAVMAALTWVLLVSVLPPFSLAEQESGSPNYPAQTESTVKKSQGSFASASAGSFGIATGIGTAGAGAWTSANASGTGSANAGGFSRSGGSSSGFTKSSATAQASTGSNTKEPASHYKSRGDSSNNEMVKKKGISNPTKIKQTMTSKDDGDGKKWTRVTEATESGREVKIEETEREIKVAVKNTQTNKEVVTIAKTLEELQQKNALAYELYQRYSSNDRTKVQAQASNRAGSNAEGIAHGFGGTVGFGDSRGISNANELLKNQLRGLREQAGPLQGLLDELEKQIDENK